MRTSVLTIGRQSIFLVGGYAANAWLFAQLQDRLAPLGVSVNRPDMQT